MNGLIYLCILFIIKSLKGLQHDTAVSFSFRDKSVSTGASGGTEGVFTGCCKPFFRSTGSTANDTFYSFLERQNYPFIPQQLTATGQKPKKSNRFYCWFEIFETNLGYFGKTRPCNILL
jgi:hypothetical protein